VPGQGASPPLESRQRPGVLGGRAWRVGRIAGIDVAIDHTWVLIFLLFTLSIGLRLRLEGPDWNPLATWGTAVATSLLFFASILLHELGHSLVAQRLGVGVRSITLFVFGGLAQLESEPRRPRDEVLIALPGPLVSATLGGIFTAIAAGLRGGATPGEMAAEGFAWLGRINLTVAVFNLVPGFPLDGGRVLRGVLWARTGSFERATAAAAAAGSVFAYSLILLGVFAILFAGQLLGGLWLVFIGWFLLSAARASVGQVVLERILGRVRVADAMDSVQEATVSGAESVADVVAEAVLRRGIRTLYVVDPEARLRGLVTLRELAQVGAAERPQRSIEEIMRPLASLETLAPDDSGWLALRRMMERNVNQLPVVEEGVLLGSITRERLLALVQAELALGSARAD
jgi:Zn-dependent protease